MPQWSFRWLYWLIYLEIKSNNTHLSSVTQKYYQIIICLCVQPTHSHLSFHHEMYHYHALGKLPVSGRSKCQNRMWAWHIGSCWQQPHLWTALSAPNLTTSHRHINHVVYKMGKELCISSRTLSLLAVQMGTCWRGSCCSKFGTCWLHYQWHGPQVALIDHCHIDKTECTTEPKTIETVEESIDPNQVNPEMVTFEQVKILVF